MDDARPSYYAVIPADVRYDDRIPANAKLLYGEISALIGADGFCFASNQYFANIYRMSVDSITRLIKQLEDHGYIKRELERDKSGQVVKRKIYLSVSVPDVQPPDIFTDTPLQNYGEGTCKKDGYTNLSNTDLLKENKKENEDEADDPSVVPPPEKTKIRKKAKPLDDAALNKSFVEFIESVSTLDWSRDVKNSLYFALGNFYAPRETKKQEPSRMPTAVTTLVNRLARDSQGDPLVMIGMLERATISGWKSVFPPGGTERKAAPNAPTARRNEEWL